MAKLPERQFAPGGMDVGYRISERRNAAEADLIYCTVSEKVPAAEMVSFTVSVPTRLMV
jgi:hypothetical protein